MIVFCVGVIAAATAPNVAVLIAGRAVQGMGRPLEWQPPE